MEHADDSSCDDPRRHAYVLVRSPDAPGGIARATANLANGLVERFQVEVIGLERSRTGPRYAFDPSVRLRYLSDQLDPRDRWSDRLPSVRPAGARRHQSSTDRESQLRSALAELRPGIVISTRPSLHLAAVRFAPGHCVTIGQDHLNLEFRLRNGSFALIRRAIGRLDRFVVLTEADANGYREAFPNAADRIHAIHNAAPWPVGDADEHRRRIVLAAGQLGIRKGFDRLIEAFALVAAAHPGWRLNIHGSGPRRDELQALIRDRGLTSVVQLRHRSSAMDRMMERASIFALTSRNEGFPMVLVEAMTKGLPVVSYDCPRGPAEIVVDQETGFLVDDGDQTAFAVALARLMDDPRLRHRMSAAALRHAHAYQPAMVMQRWFDLLDTAWQDRPDPL